MARVDPPANPGDFGIHPKLGTCCVPPLRVTTGPPAANPEPCRITPAAHGLVVNPDGTFSTKQGIFYGATSGSVLFVGYLKNGVFVENP